jgi:YVTN family beta-propeller protein
VTRAALALAALLLAAPSASARVSGGTPVALVTAETENQLVAVDVSSGRVVRRVQVAADPQNVVANQRVVVVVSPGSGSVTLLGARSLHVASVLRGFGAPHLAALSPNGKWAFVTDDPRGTLDVVSLPRHRVVNRLYVGVGAHHLSVSPDGRLLWIALGEHAREIAIVNVSRPSQPQRVLRFSPGFVAHDVTFTPSGRRVWVTSAESNRVAVFDAASRTPIASLTAGPPPQHVAFADGEPPTAYVTSGYASRITAFKPWGSRILGVGRVSYGSFNLATAGSWVVTASLVNGTLTRLDSELRAARSFKVAPATRGIATVVWP